MVPSELPSRTAAEGPIACLSPAGQAILDQVRNHYHAGKYLQAWRSAQQLGPLKHWQGTAARILAGRLANNLGGGRLGRVVHYLAWRTEPANFEAGYFRALSIFSDRGPWPVLKFMGEAPPQAAGTEVELADWHALRAHALGALRDFDAADRAMAQARVLAERRAWVYVENASLLELEDRPTEALAAAQTALELRPFYRPAVQVAGHLLVQLNRDEEALQLLREASERLESGAVLAQLAALETELEHYQEARALYDRLGSYYPLLPSGKDDAQWLLTRQSDAAYHCGDYETARRLAQESGAPFHAKVAERIEAERETGRRVMLPVGFVRQHHVTCAPATLAAVSAYWQRPVDHWQIVVDICYDGTPGHQERNWAEENGFVAREFRVTFASAEALLERGLPFTLTTVGTAAGHLQAVIGFDTRRGTLLVRDPSQRHWAEFLGAEMVEFFRASGPRGMVMVPRQRADELLAGLELPEAELYDANYALDRALEGHRRDEALRIHNRMREIDPHHRLTLHARCVLAHYDADMASLLQATEQLLLQFPEDTNLQLGKLYCLRELGRRDERLSFLQQLSEKKPDPVIWQNYAQELAEDMRQEAEAAYFARRAMRWRPQDGRSYALLADLAWGNGRRAEAMELYRTAACLDEKDEGRSRSYLLACRLVRQTEVALDFLRQRFARFGRQSSWPARTLAWAYEQGEQPTQALAIIEEARRLRPDDGELTLFAADLVSRYGDYARGRELLESCRTTTHWAGWLRAAARLASYQGELQSALRAWQQVLEAEPLARDANDAVATLLADLEGEEAGLAHLRQVVERFPHHVALRALWVERLGAGHAAGVEAAVRPLLEINPVDPWARRELAIALFRQDRWDEALAETETAERIEPGSPVTSYIRARVFLCQGHLAEAAECCRETLRRSVDYEPAMGTLVDLARSRAERIEALKFIYGQLVAQVIHGDGLLTFRDVAGETFEPAELLGILREALAARPDLWHAWSAVVRELAYRDRHEEALALAQQAVERFPLMPRMWLDLALVCRGRGDRQGEEAALAKTVEINPGWGEAARRLAEFHQEGKNPAEARAVLERALASEPRDAQLWVTLAQTLHEQGNKDLALEKAIHAVRLQPGLSQAWDTLRSLARELERPEVPVAEARRLTQTRAHEARSWYLLADLLEAPSDREECLAALDRAIELNPRFDDAHGLRCWYLAEDGRFDEALAACQPAVYEGVFPVHLLARAADVEMRRGNSDEAFAKMKALVRDDADYYYGWYRLAQWYRERQEQEPYLEASEQMVRLAPHQAMSYGYRGEAQISKGNREAAKADFRKAQQLDPAYTFAAFSLAQLCLEDGDGDGALAAMDAAKDHLEPEWYESFALRARITPLIASTPAKGVNAAFAGQAVAAEIAEQVQMLTSLCTRAAENNQPLREALQFLKEARAGKWVEETLEKFLGSANVNAGAARAFVEFCAERKELKRVRLRLRNLKHLPDVWSEAAQQWVHDLAALNHVSEFESFVGAEAAALRTRHATWHSVANSRLMLGQNPRVIKWCHDWRKRSGLTPRMLAPLVCAYWFQLKWREGVRVSQEALRLEDASGKSRHYAWLAQNALMKGDWNQARHLLSQINQEELVPVERRLVAAALPICQAGEALAMDRRAVQISAVMAKWENSLHDDWGPSWLRSLYYRLCSALHQEAGNHLRAMVCHWMGPL